MDEEIIDGIGMKNAKDESLPHPNYAADPRGRHSG